MRQAVALLLLGVAALALQGFLASLVPGPIVPDLTLALTVAGAVVLEPVTGLLFAACLGFGADVLSGSLLGQHAFARVVVFGVTLFVSGQFQLQRGFPLFVFVLGVALADALLLELLGRVLGGFSGLGLWAVAVAGTRAFATAGLAPAVVGLVARLRERLLEVDGRRREVRLETRRPVL